MKENELQFQDFHKHLWSFNTQYAITLISICAIIFGYFLGQFQDVVKTTKNVNTFQVLLHTSKFVSREIKFGYTATSSMIIAFSLVLGTINFEVKDFALFLFLLLSLFLGSQYSYQHI